MEYKKIKLNVGFEEKDLAKSEGARWDNKNKCWYFLYPNTFEKFSKWLPYSQYIATDRLVLVEFLVDCYKCKSKTRYCALYIEGGIFGLDFYSNDSNALISIVDGLPQKFYDYLQQKYTYKEVYNNTKKQKTFEFCCDKCGATIGAYHSIYDLTAKTDLIFKINRNETKNYLVLSEYAPQLSVPEIYAHDAIFITQYCSVDNIQIDGPDIEV